MLDERKRERVVALLLRIFGVVLLLAVGAIFLPVAWMAEGHRWLGLGVFPASPLVDYLTRSISALYAIHGGLLLVVARDVRRHLPVIVYLAWVSVLFGVVLLGIDVHAGMPRLWTLTEGPPLVVVGIVLLVLVRGLPRE